jgi:excisionase family DNA binding protein
MRLFHDFFQRGLEIHRTILYDKSVQSVLASPSKPIIMTPESLLKTNQVAKALGVSASTIKRWVDSGLIEATKTVGGHRLISLRHAMHFAIRQGLNVQDLGQFANDRLVPSERSPESLADALVQALRLGRLADSRALIEQAYALLQAPGLADQIIRPVMHRIGTEWQHGSIEIYQEHRATRIVESAILDLIRVVPSPHQNAPLALGCAPEGDFYSLPGLLCELTLRDLGWNVSNLGPNLPLDSLATAIRVHRPRIVWLSLSHLTNPQAFAAAYRSFYASIESTGTAVILGGQALTPELRAQLRAASIADRMIHLAEFARLLVPAPVHNPSLLPLDTGSSHEVPETPSKD